MARRDGAVDGGGRLRLRGHGGGRGGQRQRDGAGKVADAVHGGTPKVIVQVNADDSRHAVGCPMTIVTTTGLHSRAYRPSG